MNAADGRAAALFCARQTAIMAEGGMGLLLLLAEDMATERTAPVPIGQIKAWEGMLRFVADNLLDSASTAVAALACTEAGR